MRQYRRRKQPRNPNRKPTWWWAALILAAVLAFGLTVLAIRRSAPTHSQSASISMRLTISARATATSQHMVGNTDGKRGSGVGVVRPEMI